MRERYFNALAMCSEVKSVSREKTVSCEFRTHLHAMAEADTMIAVYDPGDPLCEREVAAGVVARTLGKQLNILDPKAIRLF